MRIGIRVRPGSVADDARAAEAAGLFGVVVGGDDAAMVAAATAATATSLVRIIVELPLDADHPLTLAEDLAVLDNVSRGRVVALLATGSLDVATAVEAAGLVRAGLGERPVSHAGPTWRVPAGIEGQDEVEAVQVTPATVQVQVPTWVTGAGCEEVAAAIAAPAVAATADGLATAPVVPATARLDAGLDGNRARVVAWAEAGATHLLADVAPFDEVVDEIALHLAPEVAMPHFPRVISETMTPRPWPGPARYVDWNGALPGAGA